MESVDAKARSYVKNPNLPQLYTVQTMNGLKAALMVSELHGLKELDGDSFDFETHTVDIRHAESRSKDFMRISPAGKIPALVDFHGPNNQVKLTTNIRSINNKYPHYLAVRRLMFSRADQFCCI
jgi:GST-like protein